MQVDLDRNRVTHPPHRTPTPRSRSFALPSSLREQLEAHLNSFVDVYRPPDEHSNTELDSYTAPLESTDAELATFQELNIRLTFMRVIIRFLGEYRRFCILREEDEEDEVFDLDRLFDRKAFLASFPAWAGGVRAADDRHAGLQRLCAEPRVVHQPHGGAALL